jgi:phage shock protein PspC (stress-responsive transcriptional regulator)
MMEAPRNPGSGAAVLGGAALIVLGLWWLASEVIPQSVLDVVDRSAGAITLVALGVVLILLSRRGAFHAPRTGTRLYRSRNDRLLGGVLGGLGAYLGIDPLVLRIAVALLTVLGAGGLVLVYILMWVLVPEEPLLAAPGAYAPPVPPAPGA